MDNGIALTFGLEGSAQANAGFYFFFGGLKGFDDECHHHRHSSVPQIKTVPRLEDQGGTLKTSC